VHRRDGFHGIDAGDQVAGVGGLCPGVASPAGQGVVEPPHGAESGDDHGGVDGEDDTVGYALSDGSGGTEDQKSNDGGGDENQDRKILIGVAGAGAKSLRIESGRGRIHGGS